MGTSDVDSIGLYVNGFKEGYWLTCEAQALASWSWYKRGERIGPVSSLTNSDISLDYENGLTVDLTKTQLEKRSGDLVQTIATGQQPGAFATFAGETFGVRWDEQGWRLRSGYELWEEAALPDLYASIVKSLAGNSWKATSTSSIVAKATIEKSDIELLFAPWSGTLSITDHPPRWSAGERPFIYLRGDASNAGVRSAPAPYVSVKSCLPDAVSTYGRQLSATALQALGVDSPYDMAGLESRIETEQAAVDILRFSHVENATETDETIVAQTKEDLSYIEGRLESALNTPECQRYHLYTGTLGIIPPELRDNPPEPEERYIAARLRSGFSFEQTFVIGGLFYNDGGYYSGAINKKGPLVSTDREPPVTPADAVFKAYERCFDPANYNCAYSGLLAAPLADFIPLPGLASGAFPDETHGMSNGLAYKEGTHELYTHPYVVGASKIVSAIWIASVLKDLRDVSRDNEMLLSALRKFREQIAAASQFVITTQTFPDVPWLSTTVPSYRVPWTLTMDDRLELDAEAHSVQRQQEQEVYFLALTDLERFIDGVVDQLDLSRSTVGAATQTAVLDTLAADVIVIERWFRRDNEEVATGEPLFAFRSGDVLTVKIQSDFFREWPRGTPVAISLLPPTVEKKHSVCPAYTSGEQEPRCSPLTLNEENALMASLTFNGVIIGYDKEDQTTVVRIRCEVTCYNVPQFGLTQFALNEVASEVPFKWGALNVTPLSTDVGWLASMAILPVRTR